MGSSPGSPLAAGRKQADYGACEAANMKPIVASSQDSPDNFHEPADLLHRMAQVIPGLGIILSLGASVFLGSAGMLVKVTHSVHGIQIAVFRAIFQLLIYGLIISYRRTGLRPAPGELRPVIARALLGASSITFSYYALRLIPLGDATTIRFSLPIWTLIASYLLLGEQCSLLKVGAVCVSLLGVALISKPDECTALVHLLLCTMTSKFQCHDRLIQADHNQLEHASLLEAQHQVGVIAPEPARQLEGCLLALASSICLAMSLIALRLCKNTNTEITIWWLSVSSVIVGTVTLLTLGQWSLPDNLEDVGLILLNGLCGSIGQWFITSALKIEQSGIISLARTFDIEVAFLYSALLLHEHIRVTSIIGSLFVSSGVIAVVVPRLIESRRSARPPDHTATPSQGKPAASDN